MTTLNIRVEEKTKVAARKALKDLGLDLSTGVKLFLHQVVTEKGLPFTPTTNPKVLKAKWDAEFETAKKGKLYSAQDVLKNI